MRRYKQYDRPVDERISEYSYIHQSGCVIWTSQVDGTTAILSIEGTRTRVPVFLLERKLGRPLLKRHIACHTCDNLYGPCINVEHLYEGTHRQNTLDSINRGRWADKKGICNSNVFLTEIQVLEIKETLQRDSNIIGIGVVLARRYNVTPTTISKIRTGKLWSHLHVG